MTSSQQVTDLVIEGMTCASCARRVERNLVGDDATTTAHVNFATGSARVTHDAALDVPTLVTRVNHAGYGAHVATETAQEGSHHHADPSLLRRWRLAVVLTVPIVAWMLAPALRFDGWEWAALVLGTPVAVWCAWPFHRAALRGAHYRAATMDTLVSIGITAAWAWSWVALLVGDGGSYVEVAAVTTTLVLTGRVLEDRARQRAGDALRGLLELAGRDATVVAPDGTERVIPVAELAVGDRFRIAPGARIATDGVVEEGISALDTSAMTGEALPVTVRVGDEVLGGTQNIDGRLLVRATRIGSDTALAQIAQLVSEAQAGQAPIQRLADRISSIFVPIVLTLAAGTLLVWLTLVDASGGAAVSAAVAVLIVACPCALGLATPTALLVGSGRGARLGIVIRGPQVLEQARTIDTVVLDKTGTITSGTFTLVDVLTPPGGTNAEEALARAGALEAHSEHPLGRAIAIAAREAGALADVDDFRNVPGLGVTGQVDGVTAAIGRMEFMTQLDVQIDPAVADLLEATADGTTAVCVAWDGHARAVLVLRDEPRADSAGAVAALRRLGVEVVMATGDSAASAHAAAAATGIQQVHAELLPAGKAQLIEELQRSGRRVAMVGDGINDAPALARADLGIAIGTGADVAIEASDLTLVSASLWSAVDAIRLARATLRRIRINLFWAFAYNVAALPLAAAGMLQPMVAGAAMAASSLFVVGGSLALRRFTATSREIA